MSRLTPRPNRQGRLFAPLGMHKGSPAAFEPNNWAGIEDESGAKGPSVPGHTVAWHATDDKALPARDDPERSPNIKVRESEYDDDYEDGDDGTIDSEGRRMANFGSAVGLHFGTQRSAIERSDSTDANREFVHPVTFNDQQVEWARTGNNSGPWSDHTANYGEHITDKVEDGKVIPYRNEREDSGSTSYRALPQSVSTWGEQVLEARDQHDRFSDRWGRREGNQGLPRPSSGQVAAAEAGFNPVIPLAENTRAANAFKAPAQVNMFDHETFDNSSGKYVGHGFGNVSTSEKTAIANNSDQQHQVEHPNDRRRVPIEQRHDALSRVQFMQTGFRE